MRMDYAPLQMYGTNLAKLVITTSGRNTSVHFPVLFAAKPNQKERR